MVVEHGGESCACSSRVSKEALLVVRERWLVVRWVQQLGVEIGAVNERRRDNCRVLTVIGVKCVASGYL